MRIYVSRSAVLRIIWANVASVWHTVSIQWMVVIFTDFNEYQFPLDKMSRKWTHTYKHCVKYDGAAHTTFRVKII